MLARRPDAAQLFAANDFAGLRDALDEPFITDEELEMYVKSWREPDALAGALRWFHAEGLGPASHDGTPARGNVVTHIAPLTVTVPTLVLYSNGDRWIRPASHRGLERYGPDLRFIEFDGRSHWITEEHPELVSRHVREFSEAHLGNRKRQTS